MTEKRFEEIYTQGKMVTTKILRDNETGVLYMSHKEGYGVGLTVMMNENGKPLIDKEFKKL